MRVRRLSRREVDLSPTELMDSLLRRYLNIIRHRGLRDIDGARVGMNNVKVEILFFADNNPRYSWPSCDDHLSYK